jgi:hypothetical protein
LRWTNTMNKTTSVKKPRLVEWWWQTRGDTRNPHTPLKSLDTRICIYMESNESTGCFNKLNLPGLHALLSTRRLLRWLKKGDCRCYPHIRCNPRLHPFLFVRVIRSWQGGSLAQQPGVPVYTNTQTRSRHMPWIMSAPNTILFFGSCLNCPKLLQRACHKVYTRCVMYNVRILMCAIFTYIVR